MKNTAHVLLFVHVFISVFMYFCVCLFERNPMFKLILLYVDAMYIVLTRSLEEKAHAEGRISLCQHIHNPCVYVCEWACMSYRLKGGKRKNASQ